MGLIILLLVIIAVSISLFYWGFRKDYEGLSFFGILIGCISLFILIVAVCQTFTLKEDFAYIESQYNNLKEQIEYCDRDDIVTDSNLRKQVLDMNNTIAKHREYSHNVWIGMYYSEHIGCLENLKWKSNK